MALLVFPLGIFRFHMDVCPESAGRDVQEYRSIRLTEEALFQAWDGCSTSAVSSRARILKSAPLSLFPMSPSRAAVVLLLFIAHLHYHRQ